MIVLSPERALNLASSNTLNNPFVAWDNVGRLATLGGFAVLPGGERANAVTGSTYDRWRPDPSGLLTRTLSFDFGTARNISFAAIAAHNLFTLGGAVSVQRSSDGSTWADAGAGTVTPTSNNAIAWRMVRAGQSFRYWRFLFSALTVDALLSVGVAFLGDEVVLPQRFYQGFSPVITPTEVELQSNVSVGNELLGSSVIGRGSTLSTTIDHIPAEFIRGSDWLAFQRHFNDGGAAFFGWRPQKYPQDLHYIWRQGAVIRPQNTGPRDFMSATIEARVYNAQP